MRFPDAWSDWAGPPPAQSHLLRRAQPSSNGAIATPWSRSRMPSS